MSEKNSLKKFPWVEGYGVPINSRYTILEETKWKNNVPFEATMKIESFERGSSSSVSFSFTKVDSQNRFPMLPKDFMNMIHAGAVIENSKVSGLWQIGKRGSSYGLRYLGKDVGELK